MALANPEKHARREEELSYSFPTRNGGKKKQKKEEERERWRERWRERGKLRKSDIPSEKLKSA